MMKKCMNECEQTFSKEVRAYIKQAYQFSDHPLAQTFASWKSIRVAQANEVVHHHRMHTEYTG